MHLHEICTNILSLGLKYQKPQCAELWRYGLTRNQIRMVAAQQSTALTGSFMAQVLLFSKDSLIPVWLVGGGARFHITHLLQQLPGPVSSDTATSRLRSISQTESSWASHCHTTHCLCFGQSDCSLKVRRY